MEYIFVFKDVKTMKSSMIPKALLFHLLVKPFI